MGIDVFSADEQSVLPVDVPRWAHLTKCVLEAQHIRGDVEVSLLFVDELTISSLNERFLGKSGPTDVLSFPLEDDFDPGGRSPDFGGTGPGALPEGDQMLVLLGDIVICPTVAAKNAEEHQVSFEDELALLVVHGILHLLGMDHEEDAEAEMMELRERELLAKFHVPASPPPA